MLNRVVDWVYDSPRVKEGVKAALLAASSRMPLGTNIFERDWDLLVVLDACRPDALREVAPEYEFVDEVDTIWSVGSATREWVANTYTRRYERTISETAIVSGNATVKYALERGNTALESRTVDRFTDWDMVDPETPLCIDSVWNYTPPDPWSGLVLPGVVTARAVDLGRTLDPERLVAHYMSPHMPYRARAIRENRPLEPHERNPWESLRSGTPREVVWEAYLDETRWVLDHVGALLDNYDAEQVIITADHGELFGEQGLYAHPMVPHPRLRRVPWVETTAIDTGEYEYQITPPEDQRIDDDDVTDRLANLGYL